MTVMQGEETLTGIPVSEDVAVGDQVRNGGLRMSVRSAGLLNGEIGGVRWQQMEIFSEVMGHGWNSSKGRCSQLRWRMEAGS